MAGNREYGEYDGTDWNGWATSAHSTVHDAGNHAVSLPDATDVGFGVDADGRFVFLTAGWLVLSGASATSSIGRRLTAYLDDADAAWVRERLAAVVPAPAVSRDVVVVQQSGLRRSVRLELRVAEAGSAGGVRAFGSLASAFDPERGALSAPARAARSPFSSELVDALPVAVAACDASGRLVVINGAAHLLFGSHVAAGDSIYAPELRDDEGDPVRRLLVEALDRALAGDDFAGEVGMPDVAGPTSRSTAVYARCLTGDDGPVGAVAVAYDTSARRSAEAALRSSEEQLRQAQKMEAVGRLAGGVAHDFNNLLTVIAGYSDLLVARTNPADTNREFAEEIRKAARRASLLTQQLLAFSRKQVLQPKVLDLSDAIADMTTMLDRLIGEDVTLATEFGSGLWHVRADPGQIVQVAVNLAVNARDAMPDGGRLTVATRNFKLAEDRETRYGSIPAGEYVALTVADTGCGMTPEVLEHVFEPFFTTKERGKGTGLGLATVYGVVSQSGGSILIETELGRGTSISILLPRIDGPAEAMMSSVSLPQVPEGSGTILLVEDEDGVRTFVRQTLESAGYNVVDACDGVSAIRVSESHPEAIDLLLTDVVMPHMNGRELADRLEPARPGMRVLYMSGYTDDAVLKHGVSTEMGGFIQKPFSPSKLIRTVSELLDKN